MDKQVLRLFAEAGPHAQDALNSWVTLQWVEFLVPTNIGILALAAIILFIGKAITKDD